MQHSTWMLACHCVAPVETWLIPRDRKRERR